MSYLKYLPYVVIILMFVYFTECQDRPEAEVIIKRDTVTVTKTDTLEIEKPYPVTVTKYIDNPTIIYSDTIPSYEGSQGDIINHYSDTSHVEPNYYFYYNARVRGVLMDINIGFFDNRPERVVTNTITNTITEKHYIQPKGLYIGADINTLGDISPGMLYMKNRWTFKANYNINRKAVSVGGYWKLRK